MRRIIAPGSAKYHLENREIRHAALRHRRDRLGRRRGTLAQRLAPTGKSILILERGEHLPREAENWSPKTVFIQHRYRTKEQWHDRRGQPFMPNTHYWVGGNTTFYGAALMRLAPGRFRGGAARRRHLAGLADLADRYGALL